VTSLTLRTPTLDDVFLQVTGTHFDEGEGQQPEGAPPDSGPAGGGTTESDRKVAS